MDDEIMVALSEDGEIVVQLTQDGAVLEIGMSQSLAERLVSMLNEVLQYASDEEIYDDYPRIN